MKHLENLIHMRRLGKQAVRAPQRLAGLDPIPLSDDGDSDVDSDGVRGLADTAKSDDNRDAVHRPSVLQVLYRPGWTRGRLSLRGSLIVT